MPNGGYDPIPVERHDAIVEEAKRRMAVSTIVGAMDRAAAILGISFADLVVEISKEREARRLIAHIAATRLRAEAEALPPEPLDG